MGRETIVPRIIAAGTAWIQFGPQGGGAGGAYAVSGLDLSASDLGQNDRVMPRTHILEM